LQSVWQRIVSGARWILSAGRTKRRKLSAETSSRSDRPNARDSHQGVTLSAALLAGDFISHSKLVIRAVGELRFASCDAACAPSGTFSTPRPPAVPEPDGSSTLLSQSAVRSAREVRPWSRGYNESRSLILQPACHAEPSLWEQADHSGNIRGQPPASSPAAGTRWQVWRWYGRARNIFSGREAFH